MEMAQAKRLVARLNKGKDENAKKAKLYENYSGRGMFGAKTTGVVCASYEVPQNTKHRVDNLGLDMIVY